MARECTCTDASQLGVVEIAQALRTDCENGLGAAEVEQRLARGGPNALRSVPRRRHGSACWRSSTTR